MQLTDKLVEKIGVQRTPAANPEMYKSDDYSVHLKGDNSTGEQSGPGKAGKHAFTEPALCETFPSSALCENTISV